MTAETIGAFLAPVNATLNFTSFLCLCAGLFYIKRRDLHKHRRAMTGAVTASSLFLVLYITRFSLTGAHSFAGTAAGKSLHTLDNLLSCC